MGERLSICTDWGTSLYYDEGEDLFIIEKDDVKIKLFNGEIIQIKQKFEKALKKCSEFQKEYFSGEEKEI